MPSTSLDRSYNLPSAFASACRMARSESELFERCRQVLIQRFDTDLIWLSVARPGSPPERIGGPDGFESAVEVSRCVAGPAEIVIYASTEAAPMLEPEAGLVALGLAVVLELRAVIQDRQVQLDDAVFQLRALRQVARLLSSVHSTEETEHLVLDFMSEVFRVLGLPVPAQGWPVSAATVARARQELRATGDRGFSGRPLDSARQFAHRPT